MDIQNVITLIDAVSNANIMNFQIEEGNFRLSMDKLTQRMEVAPAVVLPAATAISTNNSVSAEVENKSAVNMDTQSAATSARDSVKQVNASTPVNIVDDANVKIIESPIVGTYYSAAGPDSENFVKIGDKVKEGQILCIVEAMKLMNDIESDYAGEIVEILVQNEQMVEYGQPLFKIKV